MTKNQTLLVCAGVAVLALALCGAGVFYGLNAEGGVHRRSGDAPKTGKKATTKPKLKITKPKGKT